LGIFGAYQLGIKAVTESQRKITATALAQGELEKIINLPYQSIGIINGFPDGILASTTKKTLNNVEYTIERQVDFVVDQADGITLPEDDCPNDYKRVGVFVSWLGILSPKLFLSADIAPKNLAQECGSGGGVLSVSVFDAYGAMVGSPFIEIKDLSTDHILKTAVPLTGQHYFSLATSTYRAVVSKNGYSQERTYGIDEIAAPQKPNPIVLEGMLVEQSFSIDKLSSFSVKTLSRAGEDVFPMADVTFNLRGEKITGCDEEENPVYKYSENHTSDSRGEIEIPNLEWDNYVFSVQAPPTLDLVETEPSGQPIALSPNSQANINLYLGAENSLLLTLQDEETLEPIFAAATTLFNSDLNYNETQYTNEDGQTYFIPLEEAVYTLVLEAAGYLPATTTIAVSGDAVEILNLQRVY
jgi:hypothetical protein